MAESRLIGSYPVIGIRPTIDGRRGPMQLRESLEPTVWAMANAAKKLFEENLFYLHIAITVYCRGFRADIVMSTSYRASPSYRRHRAPSTYFAA